MCLPGSQILHTCQQGYCPQRYQACNHFKWSAHEHTCHLQVPLHWHKHLRHPKKWQGQAPHLPVAFTEIAPMLSPLPHFSYVLITWQSKRPHWVRASCWTLSMCHPCSHIWHTCQWDYSWQRHWTQNYVLWFSHLHTCPPPMHLQGCMHSVNPLKWQGSAPQIRLASVEKIPMPSALDHISHVQYHGSPRDHIMWGHLVKPPPSILHAPAFCIHVCKVSAHKDIWLQPLLLFCSWGWLPSSSASTLEHALKTTLRDMQRETGNLDGAWCHCSHLCFHPCRFPIVARVPAVSSYVWIRILSIPYNQDKCDQPCIQQCLHRPSYEKQTRELEWPPLQTRELWQKNLICLPSPTCDPTTAKDWKELLPRLLSLASRNHSNWWKQKKQFH